MLMNVIALNNPMVDLSIFNPSGIKTTFNIFPSYFNYFMLVLHCQN